MMHKTCLIGLGNILMQDDGVGVHVVKEIGKRFRFTPGIDIVDGGTLGLALLPLLDGYDRVLFVDAMKAGLEPGTIVVKTGGEVPAFLGSAVSVHQTGLADLMYAATFGGFLPAEVSLVGIEPQSIDPGMEATPLIRRTIEGLIRAVLTVLVTWQIRALHRPPATDSP